ncbi:MAG: transglutaminase-like domain-containing protein [Myxococcales bacterium]|nr:transglutaminase-like domain-containing protein [Myxococcota bacterium]MDW8280141.1 transglutaminase-like domain-containing protein [Myxococcales bacterium]
MLGRHVSHPDVALFAHLACRAEQDLDLGRAALSIAAPDYLDLDVSAYVARLDELAEAALPQVRGIRERASRAASLVAHLVHHEGFGSTGCDPDDPRNSFLHEVLQRRVGLPISLAVVMMEVGRRLGVPLYGVSFPGHFLLRAGDLDEAPLLLDPCSGRPLGPADLAELLHRATGQRRAPRPQELQVARKAAILLRMLTNLQAIYMRQGDQHRLHLVRERQRLLRLGPRALGPGGSH